MKITIVAGFSTKGNMNVKTTQFLGA